VGDMGLRVAGEDALRQYREEKFASVAEILEEEEIGDTGVLGKFDRSGRLRVVIKGKVVCDLDLEMLYSPPQGHEEG